ncbi:MAG: hypothetical protein M3239_07590 [Thermoproteota archaeon]|nr:hypothetical protein [Thermoproteota archaeon]
MTIATTLGIEDTRMVSGKNLDDINLGSASATAISVGLISENKPAELHFFSFPLLL